MKFSRTEWLLIASVFMLGVATNLPAGLQAAVPVTPATVQLILCLLLVFSLVRYVPLPITISLNMLLVGSGIPWILDKYFGLGYRVSLVIMAIMLLLSLGYRSINARDPEASSHGSVPTNVTALFRVVERGNLAWTQRLIAMRADVNVRNDAGQTPLMSAAEKGYADMVQVLLQNGANPKLANNQGDSALTIALMKGYTRIAESLEMAEVPHKYEPSEDRG